jgi:hypothetical protein
MNDLEHYFKLEFDCHILGELVSTILSTDLEQVYRETIARSDSFYDGLTDLDKDSIRWGLYSRRRDGYKFDR